MSTSLIRQSLSLLLLWSGITTAALDVRLKRNLLKSGFHRDLESIIVLPLSIRKQCESAILMMLETLPSGIYVDPFQTQAVQQFGGPQILFDRPVDIEAAAFSSREHKLKVFINFHAQHDTTGSFIKDVFTTKIKLPIQVRYHQPSHDPLITESTVTIYNPKLYLNCLVTGSDLVHSTKALVVPYNGTNYEWYQVSYKSVSSKVVLQVPVGQEKDKPLVLIITLLVTISVSAVLCRSIFGSNFDLQHCKAL